MTCYNQISIQERFKLTAIHLWPCCWLLWPHFGLLNEMMTALGCTGAACQGQVQASGTNKILSRHKIRHWSAFLDTTRPAGGSGIFATISGGFQSQQASLCIQNSRILQLPQRNLKSLNASNKAGLSDSALSGLYISAWGWQKRERKRNMKYFCKAKDQIRSGLDERYGS